MPEIAGKVADAFAERVREQEEQMLSPLAVRSYETRGRERAEDDCAVRTPFQRDRDRIVHSKAFRRLKGKTQVFIDPDGDHYRTRMTHTLETTAISRVVARALRLNEDLVEAIGLGHDMGTRRSAMRARTRSTRCSASVRPRRSATTSSRFLDRRARLNLTHEVCDGILTTPARASRRRSRARSSGSSTASRTSTTTSTTRCASGSSTRPTCRATRSSPRPDRSRRIDALVHDLVETRRRRVTSASAPEVGEAMLSLRAFMFERVYLGPQVEPEHRRARDVIRRVFDHLIARGDDVDDGVDYVAGMTDRFALAYARDVAGY